MITVAATKLETARKNPGAFGILMAGPPDQGGNRGMFSCMIDVVRLVHIGELNARQAVREIHRKFLRFTVNAVNTARQEKIVEQMIAYLRQFRKEGFDFYTGAHRINWEITRDVKPTGLTPWVAEREEQYYSYLIAELSFDWVSQLRFPLYHKYLANHTLECDENEVNVGMYFADRNEFDFRTFSTRELKLAVNETGEIFTALYKEYKRVKRI